MVAGKTSPWARRRRVRLAELVNEPWILAPENPNVLGSLIAEAFHASGLEVPRATVLTYSLHIRNGLLASGRYLTILPGSMLHFGASYLPLKVLPIELPIKPRPVGIVTLRNRTLNPVAQLFLDCAREVARPLAKGKLTSFKWVSSVGKPFERSDMSLTPLGKSLRLHFESAVASAGQITKRAKAFHRRQLARRRGAVVQSQPLLDPAVPLSGAQCFERRRKDNRLG